MDWHISSFLHWMNAEIGCLTGGVTGLHNLVLFHLATNTGKEGGHRAATLF